MKKKTVNSGLTRAVAAPKERKSSVIDIYRRQTFWDRVSRFWRGRTIR